MYIEYSEHDMDDMRYERDLFSAQVGRQQNLAYQARILLDRLICADGPDSLWIMVCAGMGPEAVKLDGLLRAIEKG